jgi:hypothetical protein
MEWALVSATAGFQLAAFVLAWAAAMLTGSFFARAL